MRAERAAWFHPRKIGGAVPLVVQWGDGGVHQGPVTEPPEGIEFYGKRYAKPIPVNLAAIAGRWEAARGSAIAGGAGINRVGELVLQADGRYQWGSTTGGVVSGRAVASDRLLVGQVTVKGLTIIFRPDAGVTASHTFLPAPGTPVSAFSVDADIFTRISPAPAPTGQLPDPQHPCLLHYRGSAPERQRQFPPAAISAFRHGHSTARNLSGGWVLDGRSLRPSLN